MIHPFHFSCPCKIEVFLSANLFTHMTIEYILFHNINTGLPRLRVRGRSYLMEPSDPDFKLWVDNAKAFGATDDEIQINFSRANCKALICGDVSTNNFNQNLTTVNHDPIVGCQALVHSSESVYNVYDPQHALYPLVMDTFVQLSGDLDDRVVDTFTGTITLISSTHTGEAPAAPTDDEGN
jgi:hypothetical protein